jgi:hypothetical protein
MLVNSTIRAGIEDPGESAMIRRMFFAAAACVLLAALASTAGAQERAFSRYPQNFWGNEYYRSSEDLYFRYPPEMRVPVYNKQWQNYYPEARRYHQGHQFILDVF